MSTRGAPAPDGADDDGDHGNGTDTDPAGAARDRASGPARTTSLRVSILLHAMLLGVVVVWGLNFLVMKAATERADPTAFNAGRFAMAFVFASAWTAGAHGISAARRSRAAAAGGVAARRARPSPRWWLAAAGVGVVGNVLYQTLLIEGVDGTTPGKAAVLLATAPLWVALMHRAFGGRSSRATWIGFVLAFAGTAALVAAGAGFTGDATAVPAADAGRDPPEWIGDLLMLGSAIAWAAYIALSKPVLARVPVGAFHLLTMAVGAAGLAVVAIPAFVRSGVTGLDDPIVVRAMLYAGVLSIGLGFLAWSTAIERLGSVYVAGFQYLVPVIALVGESLVHPDAPPALAEWLGAAAILAGVAIAARPERRGRRTR